MEVCRLLAEAGKTDAQIYVMMGELSNQAAVQRTADIHDVMASGNCGVTLNIIDEQTANWSRDEAQNLMTNWLSTGTAFDGVIANNDEMAIGAISAIEAAGKVPGKDILIVSIDGEKDGLQAVIDGKIGVTVECNPKFGPAAYAAAMSYAKGDAIPAKMVNTDRVFDITNAAASIADSY